MSKTRTSKSKSKAVGELLPEYRFDYAKAKPNRFAAQLREEGRIIVILDPDVARVFKTQESVNAVLRALIDTMPKAV